MDFMNSIFLGLLQGVGEFLPISSSAHLYLYSYLLNLKYQGLYFDVFLHLGTLFAIFFYFFNDIKNIVFSAIKNPIGKDFKFLFYIFVATIPGVVAGILVDDYAEKVFRNPVIVSFSLIFFSILIWIIDRKAYDNNKNEENFDIRSAIIAGIFQSIAIIPGASRSGMTIIALIILGYSRYAAARISFFMAMPIILGAGLHEIKKFNFYFDQYMLSGFISSFFFGILSIKFLLSYLRNKDMKIFVIYRIILGVIVLLKVLWG
jgi:undecaprenyl-diphosphatase